MDIKDEFIPYEEALALKELGFNDICLAEYNRGKQLIFNNSGKVRNTSTFCNISAPLYQQAFRWFREKHELFFNIISEDPAREDVYWFVWIFGKTPGRRDIKLRMIETYDKAELACLKKLIEICQIELKRNLQR